jgi:hypothetical protein
MCLCMSNELCGLKLNVMVEERLRVAGGGGGGGGPTPEEVIAHTHTPLVPYSIVGCISIVIIIIIIIIFQHSNLSLFAKNEGS